MKKTGTLLKLGIIGAESSHSYSIGSICNLDRKVALRATHLWGETPQAAVDSAAKAAIPHVVDDWRDMLGQVDGVMIDHRDGGCHYEVAEFFLKNGVPTFVDKPMTTDLGEARRLLTLATRKGTPLCTFGLVPLQKSFRRFAAAVSRGGAIQVMNTTGPADLVGPYGGIYFYGFHQIDAIVEIMGTDVRSVSLQKNDRHGVATLFYSGDRIATMNCLADGGEFHWRVCTDQQIIAEQHRYDRSIYLESARAIHRFIATGAVPWSRERMLAPIAILDALQKSLASGRVERVARF